MPDLLDSYRPIPRVYDEMLTPEGRVREHWTHAGRVIDELGLDELNLRHRETRRLLDDDGVTYNVYGDDSSTPTPWALDPLPVLLSSQEWSELERAVVQRAQLLNLVLADLYGRRDLLRRGLLPAQVVFAHPGFLRQCDGVRLPGSQQLFTSAVDLVRDAGGRYTVLADKTQAPSGAGYALENRIVVSRVFSGMYGDAQVHRLAPFFRMLRTALQVIAPPAADDPRIVVLTPGPASETAFEHAYLASYLGYALVEAADLTVRDGRVWLRSLGRLEPVDVILRRTDAMFCDPLELRGDSVLGVPGLVEASRLGTVSIVNTLGSGVIENPGLLPYLPGLAEHLLGQQLVLPSVPTWWCGDAQGRSHVLAHLDRLVVKPIARGLGATVLPSELSNGGRDDLRRRIEARPEIWVGQEHVEMASAPALGASGLEARRSVLRAFAVARHDSYAAMPGGLTRIAPSSNGSRISNQTGALSKDTWVLASEPEKLSGFWLQPGPPVSAIDPAASMSSRAAENLFWMGRYAERAEAVARLLRTVHDRRNEFQHSPNPAGAETLQVLLGSLTRLTSTYPGFSGVGAADRLASPDAELLALVVDEDRPGTLAYAVHRLLAAAHTVRDQLSTDTWMVVGNLERDILGLRTAPSGRQSVVVHTLGQIMQSLLAFSGLAGESMVRDPGWRFMDAGRRIERGVQLASLLQATVTAERGTATDSLLLESALIAAESIITYRRRYRSHAQLETILDLLVLDADNPRSLAYQVDRLAEDVHHLPAPHQGARLSRPERVVLETTTALRLADTAALAVPGPNGTRPDLDGFLDRIIGLLRRTSDAIDEESFVRSLPQRRMGDQ
ncbi:MAG: hypothetical protein QOJ69_1526 [Actinomycetota bacterium]|nr:hypothetical protein [Actinomycetota bacterium]